jgi:hypothetical protein
VMSALPPKADSGTPDMAHETFLNMTQTTKAITIVAAAKTIRKVLVSSAMGAPFGARTMRLFGLLA